MTMEEQLNVFEGVQFDESIVKDEFHSYLLSGSNAFDYSDEIRIAIKNQDLLNATYNSLIYIEGKLNPRDVTKTSKLTNNAPCFLFDEIIYEFGDQPLDVCKNAGVSLALKSYVSYTGEETRSMTMEG